MARKKWAVGTVLTGIVLVGIQYSIVWIAIPDRGLAREWPTYMAALLGPYFLTFFGIWSAGELAFTNTKHGWLFGPWIFAVMSLTGLMILGLELSDWGGALLGEEPPAMSGGLFLAAFVLFGQYALAGSVAILGIAVWFIDPKRICGNY